MQKDNVHIFDLYLEPDGKSEKRGLVQRDGRLELQYAPLDRNRQEIFLTNAFTAEAVEKTFFEDIYRRKAASAVASKIITHVDFDFSAEQAGIRYLEVKIVGYPHYNTQVKQLNSSVEITKTRHKSPENPTFDQKVIIKPTSMREAVRILAQDISHLNPEENFKKNITAWLKDERYLLDNSLLLLYMGNEGSKRLYSECIRESDIKIQGKLIERIIRLQPLASKKQLESLPVIFPTMHHNHKEELSTSYSIKL